MHASCFCDNPGHAHALSFAKTLADCEINNIAAAVAVCWHAEMCEAPARFRAFLCRSPVNSCRDLKTVKGNSIMAFSFETLNLGILRSSECMSKITRSLTAMWGRLN